MLTYAVANPPTLPILILVAVLAAVIPSKTISISCEFAGMIMLVATAASAPQTNQWLLFVPLQLVLCFSC